MVIIVQEASDSDILRACEAEVSAYANTVASSVLFPGPFPPDSLQQRVDYLIKERKEDPSTRYFKAVDEESGSLIAFSKWQVYKTPDAAAVAARALIFGPGTNKEACTEFFGGMSKRKKEIIGNKPHIHLHLLHTDPPYQGRGAGSMLLRWGLQEADRLGVPIYLESSPDAHRFYQKHGFKHIEDFTLDLSQYGGGNKRLVTPLMIREYQPKI